LLDLYRSRLAKATPGSLLWLAPTSAASAAVRESLLNRLLAGCFAPGVTTFQRFADSMLQSSGAAVRPINRLAKRYLLRQVIESLHQAGQLAHFGPIASTAGLLDLVDEVIGEVKRLEIWPEHWRAACQKRGMTSKDAELLAIYATYQEQLGRHQLYDAEGRSWLARDILAKKVESGAIARRWSLVVVDGFSDFTRTEHDILESLTASADEMWISLPLEETAPKGSTSATHSRSDLFRKPLRTLEELRRRHAQLSLEYLVKNGERGLGSRPPVFDHIERGLFANPRHAQAAPSTVGIEIVVAGRQINEIQRVGMRVKQLLATGVAAADIAVVFRRPTDVADLVRDVFGSLGIPFTLPEGEPLTRGPAVAMLLKLLQLDADDWPVRSLLEIVGSHYFQPDWTDWPGNRLPVRAERALRGLRVVGGRQAILHGFGALPTSDEIEQDGQEKTQREQDARATAKLLQPLAELFDRVLAPSSRKATLETWAQAWEELADHVGIFRAMETLPSADRDADRAAWQKYRDCLAASRELARWLPQEEAPVDRTQALSLLYDLLAGQTLDSGTSMASVRGCVRVLAPSAARHLRVPHLFLAGLTEKSFPLADREDRLYGEAERRNLAEAGMPLVTRDDRQGEEMLLFYELITAATEHLCLSYPGLDEKGEPLTPSPYLKEVEHACGGTPIERSEYLDLSPVARDEDPMTPAAFRVRAVADALDGKVGLLAGLVAYDGPSARGVIDGLRLHAMRQDRETFSAAEGMLGERASEDLAHRYAEHQVLSATELERYATCPYRFFLTDLLKVSAMEEPVLEIDVAQRGQKAHALFAELHRLIKEKIEVEAGGRKSLAEMSEEEYWAIANQVIEKVAGEHDRQTLSSALAEIDRRILVGWAQAYKEQYSTYDALAEDFVQSPRPELFEISFGRELREGDAAPSTTEPLVLSHGNEVVRLSGRVDRIDLGRMGKDTVFNIIDYKTGMSSKFSAEAVARGTLLQLPLYALATGELILNDRDAVPWQAGYWYLAADGFKPKQALRMYHIAGGSLEPTEEWEAIRSQLPATIVSLVVGMRQGQYPAYNADLNCTGHCPFHTVCRIHQIRSLEKTWTAPEV
jgi:ATP-dependent helicase/DNAse subunit B